MVLIENFNSLLSTMNDIFSIIFKSTGHMIDIRFFFCREIFFGHGWTCIAVLVQNFGSLFRRKLYRVPLINDLGKYQCI